MPKVPFKYQEGKRIGPDPHQAYAGNPQNMNGGWYVFAGPLVTENISGSSREEILSYKDKNIPVIVWVTLDLSSPVTSDRWYLDGTDEFHPSFTNSLHTVILDGWKAGEVIVKDPVTHPEDAFFETYEARWKRGYHCQKVINFQRITVILCSPYSRYQGCRQKFCF